MGETHFCQEKHRNQVQINDLTKRHIFIVHNIQFLSFKKIHLFPVKFVSEDFCSQLSKFLLYSTNMAWIRLVFVVFCIGSIYGLPQQDIANPSDDSKPSDLTKNSIENPSSSVDSKPNDLTDIVVFALKLALKFIWKEANCITGLRLSQEIDAATLGNCYVWFPESPDYAFRDAFLYVYFSLATQMLNSFHTSLL